MQDKIVAVDGFDQPGLLRAAPGARVIAAASEAARPVAKTSPAASFTVTASPARNRPCTAVTPTGSRLAPSRSSARRAPASTTSDPLTGLP